MLITNLVLLMSSKVDYDKYGQYLDSFFLKEEANIIVTCISKYYKELARDYVEWEELEAFISTKYPRMTGDLKVKISNLIQEVRSLPNLDHEIVKDVLKRHLLLYLSTESDKGLDDLDSIDLDVILGEIQEYKQIVTPEVTSIESWEDMLIDSVASGGTPWSINCLNRSLGYRTGGELIFIGARPDAGKTTFLAQEASNHAQNGKYVHWFNNEEADVRVVRRLIQATLNVDNHKIDKDVKSVLSEFYGKVDKRIELINTSSHTFEDLAYMVREGDLVIFDQLSKVDPGAIGKKVSEIDRLHHLAKLARRLATEKKATVISTIWADASAEGEAWIEQNQLYGVKTAWQGEADAIITMGRTHDPSTHNTRFVYIPKNKLNGYVEKERNGKYNISIEPEIARITDGY